MIQRIRFLMILALLCMVAQGAWADDVTYIERSWSGSNTGGSVVSTEKTATGVTSWNGTDNLGGGWYYFSGTKETNTHRISVSGNVNLILADGSYLKHKRGIYIQDGCTLTIYAQSGGTGKLECPSADGDNAAIGGNADAVGGHLVIHGGTIIAKADHNNAAGIGGGNHSSGMRSVTIWGGSVEAKGKDSGAGIGAGQQNDVYCNVTIYGGTVTATGGDYAAGIGGGEDRGNGTVKIYGGTVNATGMNTGAGIGGGEKGSQDNPIYIYGGAVTATGSNSAAGIGGGSNGNCGTIEIYGGTVTATSEVNGAGIGSGNEGDAQNGTITISGGTVTASGGRYGAGIGGGAKSSGANVTISGGSVTATGGQYSAGIGAGSRGTNNGTVTITGGTVIANGGSGGSYYKDDGGAGIGGGSSSSNNATITITGGTVTVKSSEKASAIGHGGSGSSDGTLNLASTFNVKSGGSPVSSGSRVSTLHSTGTYTIQVCDHSGGVSYTDKDDYYHHVNCQYCEGYDEHHVKGEGDACTYCGHELPEYAYTLYEANAEGTGYAAEGTAYYVTATHEFTFPECSNVPDGKIFAGWKQADEAPASLIVSDISELGSLKQAGDVITVEIASDLNYYARYADFYFSGGLGTQASPFQISTTEDWNDLSNAVSSGYNFNGVYLQLTNDISVSTMVGQGSNRFRGNFDGQGNTITVSYTGITEDYCAPFRCISGATIKNLNTTGTIETSGRYAAGVVAYTRYYSTIENCHSSVTIRSSHAGWAGHGGILGLKANVTMSEPTIEGCVFDGKILTTGTTEETKTTGAAGIVGYTNYQTLTIKNCLYKPAALADGETAVTDGSATLYINASGAGATTVTCTDCYYTEAYGSEQGTHGYTVTSGTSGLTLDFGSATKTYEYNGIEMYGFGLLYGGTLYSGSGQSVTFTPESDKQISSVAASIGTLTDNGDGTYTLTMPAANVTITATLDSYDLTLYDGTHDPTNAETITAHDDYIANVTISGRTLYKDGDWNTLCLPFDIDDISTSPLAGATIKELDVDGWYDGSGNRYDETGEGRHQTGYDADGTLYLYFIHTGNIYAGRPYLVKWESGDNITNPVFSGITLDNKQDNVTSEDGKVEFIGNYSPVLLTGGDASNLYLGTQNTLYWPSDDLTINAFRAYFHVDLGETTEARNIVMNLGEDGPSAVGEVKGSRVQGVQGDDAWYDLSGRKYSKRPAKKGVYIHKGEKVVIDN